MSEPNENKANIYILEALLRAKRKFGPVLKTAKGNYGKYPDLAGLLEAIEPALESEGVLLTGSKRDGMWVTTATHVGSGQFLEGMIDFVVEKGTCQGYGSALTYARRYGISAFFQLAAEDDDGQRAEDESHNRRPQNTNMPPKQSAPAPSGNWDPNKPLGFGKHKNTAPVDMPPEIRFNYASWLERNANESGKPLAGPAKAFVDWVVATEHQ